MFCIFCWNLDSQALHIWCWSLPPSPLFLSAAATEQRRRRPGLQKLENSFNPGQVTGYRYKPSHPSLLRRTLGKLFTPRAGPQGTIQMSRCLAMVFFSLRINPLPAHQLISKDIFNQPGHFKLLFSFFLFQKGDFVKNYTSLTFWTVPASSPIACWASENFIPLEAQGSYVEKALLGSICQGVLCALIYIEKMKNSDRVFISMYQRVQMKFNPFKCLLMVF